LSPKLGPMANWGLAMERKQLTVDTETFSTSVPGIFAVGDINTYPGKKKLIVCGFHECVLAAFAAAALIFPGQKSNSNTPPPAHACTSCWGFKPRRKVKRKGTAGARLEFVLECVAFVRTIR
jgi:pyruvate/2-oxoglutarate dehydrogenase complex dihydrolipoamide dehydrogenase (E3) component